jgi:hypothetical protein
MGFLKQGFPWIYDNASGDIVGVKDPDGSETYFARVPYIGAFVDLSNQTATVNEATAMECDTTEISRGVVMVDNSKITASRTATYNIAFSAQFVNSGNDEREVSIWLSKQGSNIANSNTTVTIPKKHAGGNSFLVAAWNFFVDLDQGQYAQIYWSVNGAGVSIAYAGTQTTPARPATPSVIITVNEVDGQYP